MAPSQPQPWSADAADRLTAFAINGDMLDASQCFMHLFFRLLTIDGDGARVFVARAVCKGWRAFVDAMDNSHWAALQACTVDDEVLRNFFLTRANNLHLNIHAHIRTSTATAGQGHTGDGASAMRAFRSAVSAQPGNVVRKLPGMYLLLGMCKQVAIDAACTPARFSRAFDNEMRGLAYYAVFMAIKGRRESSGNPADGVDLVNELQSWWIRAVKDVCIHVEQRFAHRPLAERQAAHASIFSFILSMSAITFHACRKPGTNECIEFRDAGLAQFRGSMRLPVEIDFDHPPPHLLSPPPGQGGA